MEGLAEMHGLRRLKIEGNPITAERAVLSCVQHYVSTLQTLDDAVLTDPTPPPSTEFQTMCRQQAEAHDKLYDAFEDAKRYSVSVLFQALMSHRPRFVRCESGDSFLHFDRLHSGAAKKSTAQCGRCSGAVVATPQPLVSVVTFALLFFPGIESNQAT